MVSNLNKSESFPVRPANLKPGLKYERMSPLGRKLYNIAREIELSDDIPLVEKDIERELRARRGGFSGETANE